MVGRTRAVVVPGDEPAEALEEFVARDPPSKVSARFLTLWLEEAADPTPRWGPQGRPSRRFPRSRGGRLDLNPSGLKAASAHHG